MTALLRRNVTGERLDRAIRLVTGLPDRFIIRANGVELVLTRFELDDEYAHLRLLLTCSEFDAMSEFVHRYRLTKQQYDYIESVMMGRDMKTTRIKIVNNVPVIAEPNEPALFIVGGAKTITWNGKQYTIDDQGQLAPVTVEVTGD